MDKPKLYTQEDLELDRTKNAEEWKVKLSTRELVIKELQESTMQKNLELEEQVQKNKELIRKGWMFSKIINNEIKLDANSEEGRQVLNFLLNQSEEMQKEFNETLEKRDELDRLRDIKPENYFQPIIDFFKK